MGFRQNSPEKPPAVGSWLVEVLPKVGRGFNEDLKSSPVPHTRVLTVGSWLAEVLSGLGRVGRKKNLQRV